MSELLHNKRTERLLEFCLSLRGTANRNGQTLKELWDSYSDDIKAAAPAEVMWLVDAVMQQIPELSEVKFVVSRMMNSFTHAMKAHVWDRPDDNPYINKLLEENRQIDGCMEKIRTILKEIQSGNGSVILIQQFRRLKEEVIRLSIMFDHYGGKELVLFPVIEKYIGESRCTQLMWAIHDDIRSNVKEFVVELEKFDPSLSEVNKLAGKLFFDIRGMIFREEFVLLPAVFHRIPAEAWEFLASDQLESGSVEASGNIGAGRVNDGTVDLGTGTPSVQQLIRIFNNLPVDLTLIDADDRVVFFSTPAHRIFLRTRAIIGRKVHNCHPPKSVAVVEKILTAFREKRQTSADFRITMGSKYILIQYFALYSNEGECEYEGTLEVSQDITAIRTMDGDKRLLDWVDDGPEIRK
ncbi:MAG: DUF438 domain-containing protein [Bacteroidetes bacterium]|nr:DUF438 domain-containing protein [Bacteroidota bacterium]